MKLSAFFILSLVFTFLGLAPATEGAEPCHVSQLPAQYRFRANHGIDMFMQSRASTEELKRYYFKLINYLKIDSMRFTVNLNLANGSLRSESLLFDVNFNPKPALHLIRNELMRR